MFDITYPVLVSKPFENITYSVIDNYKAGDIFNYNPRNTIHISLMDAGFFEQIDNSLCEYVAMRDFELDKEYNFEDKIKFEDIPEHLVEDFILAGFIKKIYNKKSVSQNKTSKPKKLKPKKISYSKIAKDLSLTPKKFKNLYFEKFNKEIKDMKQTVSKPTEKKIIEALS